MANELTKRNSDAVPAITLSREQAEAIMSVFPMARFSLSVISALGENPDERGYQNLSALFQMRMLVAAYHAINSVTFGMNFTFPISFVKDETDSEGQDGGATSTENEKVKMLWLVEHDPCGLGDFQAMVARVQYEQFRTSCKVEVDAEDAFSPTENPRPIIRTILKIVPEQVLNEVYREFVRCLSIVTYCDNEDDNGTHKQGCEKCGGRGTVFLSEQISPRFNFARWLDMFLY